VSVRQALVLSPAAALVVLLFPARLAAALAVVPNPASVRQASVLNPAAA